MIYLDDDITAATAGIVARHSWLSQFHDLTGTKDTDLVEVKPMTEAWQVLQIAKAIDEDVKILLWLMAMRSTGLT